MKLVLLATAFGALALALWLMRRQRRPRRLIERFCEKRSLVHCARDDGSLKRVLSHAFRLPPPANRRLRDVSDIATDGNIFLFRVSELLDLGNGRRAAATPLRRIAVTFAVPPEIDMFFLVSRQLQVKDLHRSGDGIESDAHFTTLERAFGSRPLPHPLAVTLARGRGLIYYLAPSPNALTDEDLECLFGLAKRIERGFKEADQTMGIPVSRALGPATVASNAERAIVRRAVR